MEDLSSAIGCKEVVHEIDLVAIVANPPSEKQLRCQMEGILDIERKNILVHGDQTRKCSWKAGEARQRIAAESVPSILASQHQRIMATEWICFVHCLQHSTP